MVQGQVWDGGAEEAKPENLGGQLRKLPLLCSPRATWP